MSFFEIMQGLTSVVNAVLSGAEMVLQFLFQTPAIAGFPLGAWLLVFVMVGFMLVIFE